jgi:hypothetical protein
MDTATPIRPGLRYGVYSYREAARLLNVSSQRVARWADGYLFRVKYGYRFSAPVLQSEAHCQGVLSFPELMELFFVREFAGLGVYLQHIRATAEALAQEVGAFPFTKKRLLVSGRELIVRTSESLLYRPDIGQLVADFAESLVHYVELDTEEVFRYYPPTFEREVFLDRQIRGGEPVVWAVEYAIPTRLIYDLWLKEQDPERVAEYFDIPPDKVSVAVRYESEWRLVA